MSASGSRRAVLVPVVIIVVLTALSIVGIVLLEQNKKSLPAPLQTIMGGRVVRIVGQAMYPTLQNGQVVTFDTRAYLDQAPQRGDIVLFIAPDNPSRVVIKRVIAIPGDRLLISNAIVSVNGQVVSEPYLAAGWTVFTSWPPSGQAATVPANQYFVMGDNRDHSSDSRSFGYISRTAILGKLLR